MAPPPTRDEPRLIVIGCGVGGIALAANLKTRVGYHNFTIYEREKSLGGTWYLNTYPGVGCDVDSHLYSFSFNLNPDWSKRFAEQAEILKYLNGTVDKFGIRSHVRLGTEVVDATWVEGKGVWRVGLHDLETGHKYFKEAEMLVSCVGTISIPKDCDIPGWKDFKGEIWHSARWNHNYNLKDKRIAVVGNGCSAAQLVPEIVKQAKQVYQFQRSPQWIHERPNSEFSAFQKWCFRYVPLWNRIYRFYLWKNTDALHHLYSSESARSVRDRGEVTEHAIWYMKTTAPEKYHDILIPKFPLGCKRRLFDPGYLECLHSPNIELTTEPIQCFTETGIKTNKREIDVDAIVLSTGFKIQDFLCPIVVKGKGGITINEHWKNTRGAQAYNATFVTGFPNFGIVFGPNAFPAHNSVIYTHEVQVEYIIKAMIKPILKNDFKVIDVKEAAETRYANDVQSRLKDMVWSAGCSNWNLDESGRNTTNSPDNTWLFWWQLYWPVWKDFNTSGGKGKHPMHPAWKYAAGTLTLGILGEVFVLRQAGTLKPLIEHLRHFGSAIAS
ncbi:FAD/NAD(P)-binding domain-containing protein [Rhizodiscina lignyota]|uniref:FAD/NAD(P)-binding domain-containing protein n=1 Tax=Rhizodiscina lignyota TaxID=1504668 RepID=A0A9P4ICP0_9PEZI|nr:FAD/NAD(P)-binding domain-containing protein [Rhizodiscina lignyota]